MSSRQGLAPSKVGSRPLAGACTASTSLSLDGIYGKLHGSRAVVTPTKERADRRAGREKETNIKMGNQVEAQRRQTIPTYQPLETHYQGQDRHYLIPKTTESFVQQ